MGKLIKSGQIILSFFIIIITNHDHRDVLHQNKKNETIIKQSKFNCACSK